MDHSMPRVVRDLRPWGMRGIDQIIRHSDRRDETKSVGSHAYQHSQTRVLGRFNLIGCPLQTFEFVESANEDAEREEMSRALERIEAGSLGVMLAGYGSRLARDEEFGARLVKAAARNDVHFVVGGIPYNPRNADERAKLMELFVAARRENAERMKILLTGKLHKARENQLMVPVPTGLMWADPSNAAYRALMEKEGLMRHLRDAQLETHLVTCAREHGVYYVLPDPFKDVYRSCEMIARWLRETLDPLEVLHRIRTDEQYPRRGLFPCNRSYVFGRSNGPRWPVANVERLRKWIDSPALYGHYVSRSPFLYEVGETEDSEYRVEDAFPSLLRPEDYEPVMASFSNIKRKWETGLWAGPRTHVLANVRCAARLPNGKPCNGKLAATSYSKAGKYKYRSAKCAYNGHENHLPVAAESLVLEVLENVFHPESFEQALRHIQRVNEDSRHRRAELRATIEGLDEDIESFADSEHAGKKAGDQDEEMLWYRRRRAAMEQRRTASAELDRLEAGEERIAELKDNEFTRIRQLAVDVPQLLRRARELDEENVRRYKAGEISAGEPVPQAFLRLLVSRLIQIVRIKHVGRGAFVLQIVFPSGRSVTRVLLTGGGVGGATPEQGLWAADQMRRGRSPTDIARELESAHDCVGYRPWHHTPWDEARVKLSALHASYASGSTPLVGTYETVCGLAERTGSAAELVKATVLAGRLGRAIILHDELAVSPTIEELDKAFPEYARQRVASEQGWPVEDTSTLIELGRELSRSPAMLAYRARSVGSGVAYDSNKGRYARRSEVDYQHMGIEVALRLAPREHRDLPAEHWLGTADALQRVPGTTESQLLKGTISFLAGRTRWFYMSPEVAATLYIPTLEEAARERDLDPAHFIDHRNICSFFEERFGLKYTYMILAQRGRKAFCRIWVRLPEESRHKRLFVYVPEAVRNSSDPEVGRAWLHGEIPADGQKPS